MLRFPLISLLLAVAAFPQLQSQGWQPAVRMWGAYMGHMVWDISTAPPMVELTEGPNWTPDEVAELYDLTTLSLDSNPLQPIPYFLGIRGIGDVDGDGRNDLFGITKTERTWVIDPMSDNTRVIQLADPDAGTLNPGLWGGPWALADVDGDGIKDVYGEVGDAADMRLRIVYGGRGAELWQHESYAEFQEKQGWHGDGRYYADEIVCTGTLEGKPVFLKAVFDKHDNGDVDTYYKLEALNQEDLRQRLPEIRTTTLATFQSEYGHAFYDLLIIFDDVWHIRATSGPKTLRVTLDGLELYDVHETFKSLAPNGSYHTQTTVYGQQKLEGNGPLWMDGTRPWMAYWRLRTDTLVKHMFMDLMVISDSLTLATRHLGAMVLATGYADPILGDIGGIFKATLSPDVDGDGVEEALIEYEAYDYDERNRARVTDLFLSGDRPTVSVSEQQGRTEQRAESRECLVGGELVRIYNVLGKQIATLPLSIDGSIAASQLDALPQQPLWAVSGDCVKRVR